MRAIFFVSFIFIFTFSLQAQLKKVDVETYYISNDNDATDTNGSILKTHSTTYRIYVHMEPGSKLRRIYGNSDHELKISGDSVFYNHSMEGQTFARNFNIARFGEGTVALDTWLTLGQTSTSKPNGKTYFGVVKTEDRNGSIVGGMHNDGGSASVTGGLLVNADPVAGIPLITADGLDTMTILPSNWLDNGILDLKGNDSTIFGSLKKGNQFTSKNAFLQNDGVMGVNKDSNQVLIAQLTTRGKIYFTLNMEIIDSKGSIFEYVAKKGADSLTPGVIQSPYLNYPVPCGCTDPNYMEYSTSFGCLDVSACKTMLVLGCMDTMACNYDPKANIKVSSFCCYPGFCNNRDIALVCPKLAIKELNAGFNFDLFPDPAQDQLMVKTFPTGNQEVVYSIYDSFGQLLLEKNIGALQTNDIKQIDVSTLASGLYLFRLSVDKNYSTKKFIKN